MGFRESHVVRFCRVRYNLFQAANHSVVLLFLPSLPSLIGGFGKYRGGKYWVGKYPLTWSV